MGSLIGDGERTAKLDENEFSWIEHAIQRRQGQGYRLDRLEASIRRERELNSQKDPAWQARP